MNIEGSIFYFFSCLAILAASQVIVSKNPVKAVLFLVLTFLAIAGLWMLLEAEFLSVILVLVYVGAVMVLFLFVVMMLDIERAAMREGFRRFVVLGFCVAAIVVLGLVYAVDSKNFGLENITSPIPHSADFSNIKELGILLYTRFLYPFELAGVLLLVAIIAAISLSFRGRRESLAPNPGDQVRVRREDRIRLINLKTVTNDLSGELSAKPVTEGSP